MTERKVLNGRLNFDASGYFVPEGDYSDAVDIRISPKGLISMEGNRPFSEFYTATNYWCACSHKDNTRRRVYAILCRDDQKHRFIYCDLDSLSITQMFENITDTDGTDIFGWDMPSSFSPAKAMKGMDVIHRDYGGDMIYFIDPNKVPLKFNDATLEAVGYGTTPTLEMFQVIKYPAPSPLTGIYDNDSTKSVNNLKKKLFQFSIQNVYNDDDASVYSSISKVILPPKADDQEYYLDGTKANVIKLIIPTGNKTVKKINLVGRVNNGSLWSDPFLIETIVKSELSLSDDSSYEYSFYNDKAYTAVDISEFDLLQDYVPDGANAQALADGRVVVYGGITEGLDKEVSLDVTAVVNTEDQTASANPLLTCSAYAQGPTEWYVQIGGIPVTGATVTVDILSNLPSDSVVSTVIAGWSLQNIIDDLIAKINALGYVSATGITGADYLISVQYGNLTSVDCTVSGSTPVISSTDSISSLKWKGRYGYGIAYYRNDGKTRGGYITTGNELTIDIPAYSKDGAGDVQVAYITLNINNAPPSWADYYHVVRTKELTSLRSFFTVTNGVQQDTDFHYLNIDNLAAHVLAFPSTASVINYSFTEGDRMRIIERTNNTATVFDSYDVEVLGVVTNPSTFTGNFIKIKKTATTSTYGFGTTTSNYLVELYTPSVVAGSNLNVYYEVGEKYNIYTDVNGNKAHEGVTQSQIIGIGVQPAILTIRGGDYYVRQRRLTTGATYTDYKCMDANFSDGYLSAVHNEGRSLVIDDTIIKQFYPGLIRFGMPYLSGSSTNQLARFYPTNQVEANASFGAILNMKSRENFIRIFQRFKIGMIPIYRQMIYDASGTQTVGLSSQVLSKPDYYIGDYGIDQYGLSLVSTDFGDYFLDDINNALVRISNDGITNISDTYSAKNWSNENILTGYSGFGGFHYEERLVFMAIVDDLGTVQNVISFSEVYKGFNSKHSFTAADNILFVDGFLWTFRGVPYVHDRGNCNYYDVQYAPSVTVYFNKGIDFKKNFVSVSTVSNRKWGCREILTSADQNSELWIEDFQMREDGYHAGFLRDKASPKGLLRGDPLKGNWISIKFQAGYTASPTDVLVEPTPLERDTYADSVLTLVSVTYNESNLNKR